MPVIPFQESLTIPAGTAVTNPETQEVTVVPGRAVLLRLYVPPGPRGEVSLWFNHQSSQLAPAPPGSWDALDGVTLEVPLQYDVFDGEEIFTLLGASPNANFDHTIDFEVLVETENAREGGFNLSGIRQALSNVLGG